MSLVWRIPWLGIEPGTSRTRNHCFIIAPMQIKQHTTLRLWGFNLVLLNVELFMLCWILTFVLQVKSEAEKILTQNKRKGKSTFMSEQNQQLENLIKVSYNIDMEIKHSSELIFAFFHPTLLLDIFLLIWILLDIWCVWILSHVNFLNFI